MSLPAIEIKGLKKSYGDVHALDGVDIKINKGEFFGLLGPNGAGKTTTINILTGLVFRDCLLYTSPSPRDGLLSRMPSSA